MNDCWDDCKQYPLVSFDGKAVEAFLSPSKMRPLLGLYDYWAAAGMPSLLTFYYYLIII